jgi:hypothetical protein
MHKIIEVALTQVGYTEEPANSNKTKYGQWAKYDGVPWCALFVSWCYNQAGFPMDKIGFSFPGFAGCQTAYTHFKESGELTLKPVSGDVFLADWNGDKRFDHTGLFSKDLGDGIHFETVEGNTSATNQSNGGQVQVRKRRYDQCVFIHPKVLDKHA